jgi:uracil-DNA glycosylase
MTKTVRTVGPRPARIAIVGEAPGSEEESSGLPFVGASGAALDDMLIAVGLDRSECLVTNVFNTRPPANNLAEFGYPKDIAEPESIALGPMMTNPSNLYVDNIRRPQLDRLRAELQEADPYVIIALGNTAAWALLGEPAITKQRGTVHISNFTGKPVKVIPTYHPAAVLRQWTLRPISCGDLAKANAESAFRERRHDAAELWLMPTLADLIEFDRHMAGSPLLSVDVETRNGQITEIGFAPSASLAINVPFRLRYGTEAWLANGKSVHYWRNAHEEKMAWRWVRKWCQSDLEKVLQNGMYDLQYLWAHGIRLRNFTQDTMLAHHSLFAELPKDLGFLGSVYTNHPSWKYLAGRARADDFKKDA